MERELPVPVRRYVIAGLLAAASIGGLLLLVRPFLFTFAQPLDDTNYTVTSAQEARNGPMLVEIVLNESHQLPGELHRDDRFGLKVIVSSITADAFLVVDAWSPTNGCALTIGADRVRDCLGDAWTFDGVPLDPADPPLLTFPTRVNNGAVVADFTRPVSPPPS